MKLVVVPNDKNKVLKYTEMGADAFIFGLENFSVNYELTLSVDEIKEICEKTTKEVFIAINKNIFNDELEVLKDNLQALDKINNIKGILFYDLSILYLKNKLNLNIDLVWNQTHMVTNYNTCNYYYEKGVKYGYLTSEITLEEIIEIKKNTKMQLMTYVLGYPTMSFSKRKLLTNYYLGNNKKAINNKAIITDETNQYLVKETIDGTSILFGKILNGSAIINSLKKVGMDYIVINDDFIPQDTFEKVLELVRKSIDSEDKSNEIQQLVGDNTGFFFKKTIFKVK